MLLLYLRLDQDLSYDLHGLGCQTLLELVVAGQSAMMSCSFSS